MISPPKIFPIKKLSHYILCGLPIFTSVAPITVNAEEDTLQFIASVNKLYDSNLFRQSVNERSDQATITTLGARFDKTYSLQRLQANIYYIDNKYQKNDFLDYAATNYDASWLWSLTPGLTGVLSSSRTERQINFRDLQAAVKNISTTTQNIFRAEYAPYRVLSLILGYSEIKAENSQSFNAIASNQRIGIDYGVKYTFPSGSYISLIGHRRNGEVFGRPLNFVQQFDTEFTDYEYDLELNIPQDGKNSFTAKLGHIEREHKNFSLRDYQAFIASANYELLITGKLKSNVGLSRSIAPFETFNSTYSLTDAVFAALSYEVTDKIHAGLNLRVSERDFDGRAQFGTSGRTDREHAVSANISWQPIKNVGLSLSTTKSNRNSTLSQFDFDDTLTSINLDLKI